MKRKIVVAVVTAALAAYLGIQSGVAGPIVDAIYCKLNSSDCQP